MTTDPDSTASFPAWDDLPEFLDDDLEDLDAGEDVVPPAEPFDPGGEDDTGGRDLGPDGAVGGPGPSVAHLDTPLTADQQGIIGHLDRVEPHLINGWVLRNADGSYQGLLHVRLTHERYGVLAEGTASDYREDVRAAGLGSGWCGFSLSPASIAHAQQGDVRLEVAVGDAWVLVARKALDGGVSAESLKPSSLLVGFAEAGLNEAVVGRAGLHFGRSVWLQAARDVRDLVRAGLHVVQGPDVGKRVSVVRVEPLSPQAGRVDLRLHLADHARRVSGGWIAVQVYGRSGTQQPIRISLFDHRGRFGLGDFVVQSHEWATLNVQVPAHDCDEDEVDAEQGSLWLELMLDASSPIDVSGPSVVLRDPDDPFECINVQMQSALLQDHEDADTVRAGSPFSVVIPFFGNAAYTVGCVNSVLHGSWSTAEVILVDDGSPEFSSVSRLLRGLDTHVRVIRAKQNAGYTASVNLGVSAASHEHVVILNNDTRVTPGWDAPLRRALEDPEVFASGPLSNAASYQSIPELRADGGWAVNTLPPSVTPARLGRGLRQRFAGQVLQLAVLNGFCYAVRKADFLRMGGLDEEAFPSGYGEEVDLMMRAHEAGMRTVVCPDAFVYHYKSVTFGGKRAELSKRGNAVVQKRWGSRLMAAVASMDDAPAFDEARASVRVLINELAGDDGRG